MAKIAKKSKSMLKNYEATLVGRYILRVTEHWH